MINFHYLKCNFSFFFSTVISKLVRLLAKSHNNWERSKSSEMEFAQHIRSLDRNFEIIVLSPRRCFPPLDEYPNWNQDMAKFGQQFLLIMPGMVDRISVVPPSFSFCSKSIDSQWGALSPFNGRLLKLIRSLPSVYNFATNRPVKI